MIYLSQVEKSYAKRRLLAGASLHVRAGEKVGLVGLNGSGKSTVLRLIVGLEEPDSGAVSVRKGARVGYLPQEVLSLRGPSLLSFIMDAEQALSEAREALAATELALEQASLEQASLERASMERASLSRAGAQAELERLAGQQGEILHEMERLGEFDLEARAKKVAAGLGFTNGDLERPVESLSGGWMMRAALARLLLAAPDVLLLDEPTNHLDLESLIWIEDYLRASRAAVLIVSHDRTFLDRLVSRIVEVEAGALTVYPGDYERYLAEKERREQEQLAAYEAQQERIEQIQRFIDRNRVRKDRARQVQARLRVLEKMERLSPPERTHTLQLRFPEPARSGDLVLELDALAKGFGERRLYAGLSLRLSRGERLALLGPNGAGKTTLLRLMAGRLAPDSGQVRHGANVAVGYFAQNPLAEDQVGELGSSRTLMEELATVAGLEVSQGQLRTLLAAFLFGGEGAFKRVSVLSGGERSRLALCKLLLSAPNLLLLDEPTNHLDIASRDVLERALEAYRGTLVIATHDRRLMNRLATRVLALEAGEWHLYAGNYDDWCRLSAQQPGQEAAQPPAAPTPEAKPARGRRAEREFKVAEAQWRQHRSRRTAPLKARLGEMLGRIEATEAELAALESELARPETYADHGQARDLHTRQRELKSELERGLIPAWEQAAGELEQLEAEIERERPRIPEPD